MNPNMDLSTELFRPSDDVIKWLVNELVKLANETPPNQNAEAILARELPTSIELASVINATFWASLQKEEGRTLLPSVYFGEPRLDLPQWELQQPIKLAPRELAKLASGTDGNRCSVGIRRGVCGDLEIWGVSSVPATAGFSIQAVDPGSLIVQRQHRTLAILKPNRMPILLSELGNFSSYVVPAGFLRAKFDSCEKNDFDLMLLYVVKTMARRRMGGTLLVVNERAPEWSSFVDSSYKFAKRPKLDDALRDYNQAKDAYVLNQDQTGLIRMMRWNLLGIGTNFRERWVAHIHAMLSVIARISSIDGAVILNSNLELLEVGAKIVAQRPIQTTVTHWELTGPNDESVAQTSDVPFDKIGGTRHQSAASFVSSYPEGAAFVVSQDGRVTMFLSNEGDGVAIFRLEVDVF